MLTLPFFDPAHRDVAARFASFAREAIEPFAAAADVGDPIAAGRGFIDRAAEAEAAQRIVDRAVQTHGGLGVARGVVVERLYREVRALRIDQGTSDIQRLVIAEQVLKTMREQPELS